MAENSTDSQSNPSNQSLLGILGNIFKDLLENIKQFENWERPAAFFLIVALILAIIAMLFITDNTIKFKVVLAFIVMFFVCIIFLLALRERENKFKSDAMDLEKVKTNLEEAKKELYKETDKRINRLGFIQKELQDIENKLRELPLSTEIELLKTKVSKLLEDVSEDLEPIDSYSKDLADAEDMKNKHKEFFENIVAKHSGQPLNQTGENE